MDATAAASKTHAGGSANVSNYVSSPFMRIFRLGRNARTNAADSSSESVQIGGNATGSVLQVNSPTRTDSGSGSNDNGLTRALSHGSSSRRSVFSSLRDSLIRTIGTSRSRCSSLRDNSSNSSNSSIAAADSDGVKNIAAKTLPSASKSSFNRMSTIQEKSPLKVRQSLSDLRPDSNSPPTVDGSGDKSQDLHNLRIPGKNPVHTARSKSLDIRKSNPHGGIADALLPANKQQSPLYSSSANSTASAFANDEDLDLTSTSGVSEASGESRTMPNTIGSKASGIKATQTRAQETFQPLPLQHSLMTLGKDLVESMEVFMPSDMLLSPSSSLDGSHSVNNHGGCSPSPAAQI
ncbi:hypothetical protein GGI23_003905 [Coemansia sp. RSA 2559]|nr:hypothetical protein GGI23_003905 [Coemansia sp. RSA 2559]